MNPGGLVHPDMLTCLEGFFPSTCTVQQAVVTEDAYGDEVEAWAALYTDLPCSIAGAGGGENKRPDMTFVNATHKIVIAGYYSGITETMRAIVDTLTLDILLVEFDSHDKLTRLTCEVVT